MNLRILVVEDTMLVADWLRDQLEELGCIVMGPVPRLRAAMPLALNEPLDGALLDVNLAGEYSFAIAAVLDARGIPYAFLTGYDAGMLPAEYRAAPRIEKPFQTADLCDLLATTFTRRPERGPIELAGRPRARRDHG